jgi:serine/threonine protein kinase
MIVMEYCERGALRECLREKLPWNLRTRISLDICHGISFLHDNSIIHRRVVNLLTLVFITIKLTSNL